MRLCIEIAGVEFRYSRGPAVLSIDRLSVASGERLFIYGPSGSGKSTLLSLIAGILRPQQGSVTVLGHDLMSLSQQRRDRLRGASIGYIFQMFNLLPFLTARENIELAARLHTGRAARLNRTPLSKAVSQLGEQLGIQSVLDRTAAELSVGQQQRVAAARALIGAPPLLIADEPTSALDAEHRDAFVQLLFAHAQQSSMTILFVSHDLALADRFDRCLRLNEINKAVPH